MPGSGRTALEAGALSVIEPGDKVLVVGAGVFGVLMREIMGRVGADVTEFPVEWGARLDLDRLAREAERAAAQGHHARAQRDLDRHHLSGGRGGPDRARGRARSSCSTPSRPSPASTSAPTSGASTST